MACFVASGAGTGDEPEAIAAAAPLAFSNPDLLPQHIRGREDLHVWNVVLGEAEYYLAAVGGRDQRPSGLAPTLGRLLVSDEHGAGPGD